MQKDSLQNRNGVVKTLAEWQAEEAQTKLAEVVAPVEETSAEVASEATSETSTEEVEHATDESVDGEALGGNKRKKHR
jgi:hypothetical protein